MIISGNKINLREIEEKDIEIVRTWRNRNRMWFFNKNLISKQQQEQWYSEYKNRNSGKFFIIELKNKLPIGTVSLYNIDSTVKEAELGRVLIGEEKFHGRGYMTEAIFTLSKFGFENLMLNRIYLHTFVDNKKATNLFEKCGFTKEEILTQTTNSKDRKIIIMSILKDKFRTKR